MKPIVDFVTSLARGAPGALGDDEVDAWPSGDLLRIPVTNRSLADGSTHADDRNDPRTSRLACIFSATTRPSLQVNQPRSPWTGSQTPRSGSP